MAKYSYKAMNNKGKEVTGIIDADSQSTAVQRIRDKGLFPTQVSISKEKDAAKGWKTDSGKSFWKKLNNISFGTGVSSKSLVVFSRQLSVLIDAGLPLLRGLRVLSEQEKNQSLRQIIMDISSSVEGGSTFSEALSLYPKVFNKLFVNMVKAGEVGGVMDVVLNRLAEFAEKNQRLQSKVKGAMIYPIVVLSFAIAILAFLLIVIIPKFSVMFVELEIELPQLTAILIGFSNFARNRWYVFIILAFLSYLSVHFVGKTVKGRYYLDLLKLRLPVFGLLFRKVSVSRFARTLGTLITSGVPMLQALTIVKDTVGNDVVSRAILEVHDSVREGETIRDPLKKCFVFPPMVISMVDVGEETGNLAEMLFKISDIYDEEVDNMVEAMSSLIEPILIVFLAGVVGTIVIAMFLPLIKLMQSIG